MTNGEIVEAIDIQTKMVRQGELSAMIDAVQHRPRNLERVVHRVEDQITLSAEVADTLFYAIPRAGDMITGPSIELAEIVRQCWGNMATATRVLPPEPERVVAQGIAYDLETLTVVERPGIRSIIYTDEKRRGQRYSTDMIRVTQMAAASIAERNAIRGLVPRHIMDRFVALAIRTVGGEEKTIPQRRRAMVEWYQERGVPLDVLLRLLRVDTLEAIDGTSLSVLRGIANAIKAGELKVEALGTAAERSAELGDNPVAADIMAMLGRVMDEQLTHEDAKADNGEKDTE